MCALTQLGKSFNKLISEKRIVEILNEFTKTINLAMNTHFSGRIWLQDKEQKSIDEIKNILYSKSEKNKKDKDYIF